MLKMVLLEKSGETATIKNAVNSYNLDAEFVAIYINGLPALEFLRTGQADILITNAEAPTIDGIDILKILKEENINVKAVVLSDRADFNYVKKAMDLNAVSYILKPVNDDELKAAVSTAIDLCKKENAEKKQHEELERRVEDSLPMLRSQFLRNMLYRENGDTEYINQNCEMLGLDLLANTKKVITAKITNIADGEIAYSTLCTIADYIADFPTEVCSFFPFVMAENELVIVLTSLCISHEINMEINKLEEAVCSRYGISLLMGVSESETDITKLSNLYRQSKIALEHAMLSYKKLVVLYEEICHKNENGTFMIKELQNDIRSIINNNQVDKVDSFLSEYMENIRQGGRVYLKIFSYSLVNLVELILSEHESSFDEVIGSNIIWDKLENFDTIINLKQWLANIIKCVMEIIHKDEGENNIIVKQIKDIIALRYSDKLTIEDIAEEISYSKKHTQRIFLKETGKTIFEYITVYRMEKAKKLLMEEGSKIYAVAENVGYKNTAHFTELFKEYTGVTPANFKKQFQVE